MKLLHLRLCNLNSLYGEWSLDFQAPPFVENGLFAITGPTGAGKSTLLDAIALALYGRTPRLGIISKDKNEIMSRDAGACFAEVTFQSSRGTFRAHWSQRRAHGRGSGNLQDPRHELTEVDSAKILSAKKKDTQSIIQEKVGLDYEQFLRSILLAQGEFASFLKSDDSQRAAILSRITGTEIYARIGTAVYHRYRHEDAAIEKMNLEVSSVELLDPTRIVELTQRLSEIDKSIAECKATRQQVETALRWYERLTELSRERERLAEEWTRTQHELRALQPLQQSLERAKRALPLRRSLETQHNLLMRIAAAESEIVDTKREWTVLDQRKSQIEKNREAIQQAIEKTTAEVELARPIWSEVNELDRQIDSCHREIEQLHSQRSQLEAICREYDEKQSALAARQEEVSKLLQELQRYRIDHAGDGNIVSILPTFQRWVVEMDAIRRRGEALSANHQEIDQQLESVVANQYATERQRDIAQQSVNEQNEKIHLLETERAAILGKATAENLREELESVRQSAQRVAEQIEELDRFFALQREHDADVAVSTQAKRSFEMSQQTLAMVKMELDHQAELVTAWEETFRKDQIIASLVEHRSRLVPDEPCPLCGSIHHPWAEPNIRPQPSNAATELMSAQVKYATKKSEHDEWLRKTDRDEHGLEVAERKLRDTRQALEAAQAKIRSAADRLLGESEISQQTLHAAHQLAAEYREREASLVERQRQADAMLQAIAEGREEWARSIARLAEAEQSVQASINLREKWTLAKQRLERDLDENRQAIAKLRSEISKLLDQIQQPWVEDLDSIRQGLEDRSQAWLESEQRQSQLEKERVQLESDLAHGSTQRDRTNENFAANQTKLHDLKAVLESRRTRRHEVFGDADPRAIESAMIESLAQARMSLKEQNEAWEPLIEQWRSLERRLWQTEASRKADSEEVERQARMLEADLLGAGFADRADLESAAEGIGEIDRWSQQLIAVEAGEHASQVRWEQKAKELEEWEGKRPAEEGIEVWQQRLDDIDCHLESLHREYAEVSNRLAENQLRIEQWERAQGQLIERQTEWRKWHCLNDLIGSADGGKYRRFAQGITFERLLDYANVQLAKLTDRYLLKRGQDGLSMLVIDHYHSSRERSAANLSGGETFLVSLAMALGLSKLASRNVQIDSLFIDEGFGTLDATTLEEALQTLASLRQEGKLVGLISHVAALHEKIPVLIEVVKGPLGKSRLEGPGIRSHR